jgi:exodeoxyribonuclease VII small subunit
MPKPPPATPPAADVVDFEQSMTELEALVERLEHGDLPLEESLRAFERGVELTRSCQQALRQAEQKVELLLARADGTEQRVPFDDAAEDEPE